MFLVVLAHPIYNFSKKTGGNVQNTREQIGLLLMDLHNKKTRKRNLHQNAYTVAHRNFKILVSFNQFGSKKFTVKDPFFSMLRRSLANFMNAFTASDWTMYPFSSQNPKDFYNLMDVYTDAVFFPLLKEKSFQQEAHRLEQQGAETIAQGVVFNEMKGAMSSPMEIMYRRTLNSVFPSITLSFTIQGASQ